ncbi:hypothetical protein ACJQWK_06427 [Exserohilum turcicum]
MKLINLILLASVVSANGVKITDDLPVLPFDELLRLAYQNASEEIKQSHFTENHRRAFDESNDITKRHSVDLFRRADPIPVVFNCLAATGTTFVVAGITVTIIKVRSLLKLTCTQGSKFSVLCRFGATGTIPAFFQHPRWYIFI